MAYPSYAYNASTSYNPPAPAASGYYNHPPAPPQPQRYGYQAPPPSMPQHQHQPASAAPFDPFRAYYADRLRELTFNSRPIIQELSVLAMQQRDQNQWGNMTAVVEEIEGAVYRSAPHEKLPKLYLLDSISKNVGAPYTTHLLQQTIPRLYIRTHREVDGVTKVKMEEMISLWRRSGPNAEELYGPGPREAVEREIFGGAQGGGQTGMQAMQPSRDREIVSRDSVLAAIHATIGVKQGEAAQRSWDRTVQTQLTALMGLSEMLNTRHVQPAELQQIMDQLRGMGYAQVPTTQPSYAQRPPLPPFPPNPMQHPPAQSDSTFPSFAPAPQPSYDHAQQARVPSYSTPPTVHPELSHSMPAQYPSAPVSTVAAPLLDANMLSILSSLTGGLALPGGKAHTPDIAAKALPVPKERTRLDDYEDMVLGLDLSLANLDMNSMAALPLDHLPVQCSQCSARFPSDGEQLNAHMDWHARRNKQERTSSGRGAHRRWLPRAEEWVNDIPVAGSSTAPDTIAGAATAAGSAGDIVGQAGGKPLKSAEELQRKWVRVPSAPGAAAAVCPICKEGFKREWSESEEEWVWRNAIDVTGKIMHATCRQQQLTANRLARVSKGRSSSTGTKSISKSPGMTPDPTAPRAQAHPLSHSVSATTGEQVVAVKEEGGEAGPGGQAGDVGAGKRKADEADEEEERKRVKVEDGLQEGQDRTAEAVATHADSPAIAV